MHKANEMPQLNLSICNRRTAGAYTGEVQQSDRCKQAMRRLLLCWICKTRMSGSLCLGRLKESTTPVQTMKIMFCNLCYHLPERLTEACSKKRVDVKTQK